MSDSSPPPGGVVKIALPAALVTAMVTALITNAVTTAMSKPAPVEQVTAKEITDMKTDIRELRGDVRMILMRLGEVSDARHNARVIDEAKRP